jgi:trans-2-enoyl-CoA reductase
VLYQGNDLDLAQINEELLELILCGAVQNEIGSENEDGGGEDWQYLKALKAKDSVPEEVDLKEGQEKE